MMTKAFLVDVEKCTGCKLCVVACKDEHVGQAYAPWSAPQPETGQFWVDVETLEAGALPRVQVSHMPTFCQHCAQAPCIPACPDDAIKTRDDGLVWIDPKACTGCQKCVDACPYNVIYFCTDNNIAQKCTGCAHRVDDGFLPRCVEVCPHEALGFGDQGLLDQKDTEILKPEANAAPRVAWRGLPKPWAAGTVIDRARDEVMVKAKVTAVDISDDSARVVETDAFGDFWIVGLEEGQRYRVEVEVDGFILFTQSLVAEGGHDLGTVELVRV